MTYQTNRNQPYLVLYKRDMNTEKEKGYGNKMLYDRAETFLTRQEAEKFALSNLPAVISRMHPLSSTDKKRARGTENPYLVAAIFYGKYKHTDYTGATDPLVTFDAIRCKEEDLERVVEDFAREGPIEIRTGIELKVF